MNKAKKNIVVVGFNNYERKSLGIPFIENNVIHYIDSLHDIVKYQGYLLLIDNKDNKSIIELDKKYRKTFNKYERIWLYNESYKEFLKKEKWSRIEKIGRDIFLDCSFQFSEEWDSYKFNKEHEEKTKYSIRKQEKLDNFYEYLKKYKTIKTEEIVKDLDIDKRTIQRYMNDINNTYHNIGYDYSNNEWYIIG